MMNLYLIQHGEAVDKTVDPERPLSAQGRRDVEAVRAFVAPLRLDLPEIWHSGKKRAQQTAETLQAAMAPQAKILAREGLDPNDPVAPIVRELSARREDLAIVGHLPHLSRLASLLLVDDEEAGVVAFRMGGIVALQRDETGRWRLRWMITPDLAARQK